MVVVREVEGKGRGVFARRGCGAGDLIERAPVIVIPAAEADEIERCVLKDYYYDWYRDPSHKDGQRAIVLGCGSLYNHSYEPNARYVRRYVEHEMDFVALRPIAEGEEICVNYNGVIDDRTPVWFEVMG